MTVQEVIDMAKFGELRNLRLGQSENEAIVSYLNLGMIELYKRFPLSIKEVLIELADVTGNEYTLPNDCMWIVSAYGEVPASNNTTLTVELSVNNEDDPLSINTVGWNKIQIPLNITGQFISLIYAAGPSAADKIVYDDSGVYLTQDIAIPMQLIEPLLHYVGYRAHGAMDGNIQSESNTHYMRFDASCKRAQMEGMLTNDNVNMTFRVSDRGYV